MPIRVAGESLAQQVQAHAARCHGGMMKEAVWSAFELIRRITLPDLVRQLVEAASEAVNAETGAILLYDPTTGQLVQQEPAYGRESADVVRCEYPIAEQQSGRHAISTWVFLTGMPYLCADARTDRLANQAMVRCYGIHNAATVPLALGDRRIGVLNVINRKDSSRFSEADIKVLLGTVTPWLPVLAHSWESFLAQRRLRELESGFALFRDLTSLLAEDCTAEQFASSVSSHMRRRVLMEDSRLQTLASASPLGPGDRAWVEQTKLQTVLEPQELEQYLHQVQASGRPCQAPVGTLGFPAFRLTAGFVLAPGEWGYLTVLADDRPLESTDYVMLKTAARLAGVWARLMHSRSPGAKEMASLLRRFLRSDSEDDGELRDIARSLSESLVFPTTLNLLACLDTKDRLFVELRSEEEDRLFGLIRTQSEPALCGKVSRFCAGLLGSGTIGVRQLERIAVELETIAGDKDRLYVWGRSAAVR